MATKNRTVRQDRDAAGRRLWRRGSGLGERTLGGAGLGAGLSSDEKQCVRTPIGWRISSAVSAVLQGKTGD